MLLHELKPEIRPQQKQSVSYLTSDLERLVKSCESPEVEIPVSAFESREALVKWLISPRENSQ